MTRYILLIFYLFISVFFTRATAYIIRLIILATLGLGGLVLYQAVQSGKPINHIQSSIGKRSIKNVDDKLTEILQLAVTLDNKDCAKQYLCEVSAEDNNFTLPNDFRLLQETPRKLFEKAVNLGKELKESRKCHEMYKKCPYKNKNEMKYLLRMWNN